MCRANRAGAGRYPDTDPDSPTPGGREGPLARRSIGLPRKRRSVGRGPHGGGAGSKPVRRARRRGGESTGRRCRNVRGRQGGAEGVSGRALRTRQQPHVQVARAQLLGTTHSGGVRRGLIALSAPSRERLANVVIATHVSHDQPPTPGHSRRPGRGPARARMPRECRTSPGRRSRGAGPGRAAQRHESAPASTWARRGRQSTRSCGLDAASAVGLEAGAEDGGGVSSACERALGDAFDDLVAGERVTVAEAGGVLHELVEVDR